MLTDFSFLQSRRFWCLVGIAILKVIEAEGIVDAVITGALITILGGFIGLTTIDKFRPQPPTE